MYGWGRWLRRLLWLCIVLAAFGFWTFVSNGG
jgi:hypothetical protein